MNNLQVAQSDMRSGYGHGSIGVLALIIGGMLIFPISALMGKLIGIKGVHDKNNPLGKLAMEGTIWMIMCIPLAYGLSLVKLEWFFQGMLMIIAGRYLTFASIYGRRIYWILATSLGFAAFVLFKIEVDAYISAFTGGLIEIIFGVIIYIQYKYKNDSSS